MALQDRGTWKILVLALVIGFLGGVLASLLFGPFFAKPGPKGPQGETGSQGLQGSQGTEGPQGIPGVNGTDAILQMLQNRNDTQADTSKGNFTFMQWFNMSEFDSSMEMTINIQQDSKIFAQFSSTQSLSAPASIWIRMVVDNNDNSSVYKISLGPPSSGTFTLPGHIEFLTSPLSAGQHTINVQFLRENGFPIILDRTLTVTEITTP